MPQFSQLPAFCRVAATLTPSADSDIKIEVWLPAVAWNGKFQAVGNGGWAISYGALASALQEGYATASTDTGHVGGMRRSRSDIQKSHRFRVSRRPRDGGDVEGRYRGLLPSCATVLAGRVAPQAGGRP